MTDETEVIQSSHIVLEESMNNDSDESQAYRDTQVTPEDRTVKFWNTATFSDITTGKQRRVKFGIDVDGDTTWLSWDSYTSPKTATPYQPETEIVVPPNGPTHNYEVKTKVVVEEYAGLVWGPLQDVTTPGYTATVNEAGGD